uniref:SSD domain-containing protein n=1 Tax=Heterorhabditis bacteriophora TaxID=37862 RepID=A0A1I7XDV0_HETBA
MENASWVLDGTDPAPHTFCVFISVAVIYDYIYQIFFFSAVLAIGGQREARRGNAYLCCLTVPEPKSPKKNNEPSRLVNALSRFASFILDSWVDFSMSLWSKILIGGVE